MPTVKEKNTRRTPSRSKKASRETKACKCQHVENAAKAGQVDFDPLLCFARSAQQTPDEVFDMLQERMKTMLGLKLQEERCSGSSGKNSSPASKKLIDWRRSSDIISAKEFDKVGQKYGLSMADVLGCPVIRPEDRKEIAKSFVHTDSKGFDPVAVLVTLTVFDRLEWISETRKMVACG